MAIAQRAMTVREWGLLALLSLLWGGSFFFVGVAVRELPPLTLVTLRVGLAAALLWASAPLIGVSAPKSGKAVGALALLGLGNNALPFACAVRRRRFPVGASPTRRTLQPEATGAVMEVTKWLKPSV